MPTQYHEPPDELSDDTRTFARVITSLQEEAEAIGWIVELTEQAEDAVEE